MKRMTQILTLGLLLSISSAALAGRGNDRNDYDGYYGGQRHNSYQNHRYDNYRNDHGARRHHVQNNRYARRHSHQHRYSYARYPYGYVVPRVRYGYSNPGLVIVYRPSAGLYIGDGY
jgi:hypothetical protein